MRYVLQILLCLMLISEATYGATEKAKKTSPKPLPEISLGEAQAPVIIIDYSSLTCHHCAEFYLKVVPVVTERYVKPGHVRFVLRDFPGDQVSLKAHQVAWCKGEMKYLDFVNLLYTHQEKWLSAKDPIAALKGIMVQNGISGDQIEAALKNQELLDKIIHARLEGQKQYKITATPTLIINAKIYPTALSIEEIEEIIKPLLEEHKKAKKSSASEKGK